MDEFEKFEKHYDSQQERYHQGQFNEKQIAFCNWQESRKQAIAECKVMDQHTRETIEESAITGERVRVVGMLRESAEINKSANDDSHWYYTAIADRIESD